MIFNLFSRFFSKPMNRYTVVYTCINGYRSFRTIEANTYPEAERKAMTTIYNYGRVIEVLPFVGNY